MSKNGVLPEVVDLLQGRIEAKNVQLGHYFKISDMKALSQQVLAVASTIEKTLLTC
jgi:hypothetical protein